jgi:hypothetical protein
MLKTKTVKTPWKWLTPQGSGTSESTLVTTEITADPVKVPALVTHGQIALTHTINRPVVKQRKSWWNTVYTALEKYQGQDEVWNKIGR